MSEYKTEWTDADLMRLDLPRWMREIARDQRVPIIRHIDARILALVKTPGNALDMPHWHACETTHCRGGWAIALAGADGPRLEEGYGPDIAARLIYTASRPGMDVPDFYCENDEALLDIEECAARDPLPEPPT